MHTISDSMAMNSDSDLMLKYPTIWQGHGLW